MGIITEDFLLRTKTARALYHEAAEGLPIIDYHCHIDPAQIARDEHFENITRVWLGGDHYKCRLIRSDGVGEDEVTGSASDREKFDRFSAVIPKCVGNPMYHWTHLELKRYFGFDGALSPDTADEVWDLTKNVLADLGVNRIITSSNVKMIGTTDDPADSLEWHKQISSSGVCAAKVCPSFRPDKAVNVDKPGFKEYILRLSEASGIAISSPDDVKEALKNRLDLFCSLGCRASDHGLDRMVCVKASESEIKEAFDRAMAGEKPDAKAADAYKTEILLFLGREYAKRGVVMQLHYGARRNVNSNMFSRLGPDTGFDCIAVSDNSEALCLFLDALESSGELPRTVVYSLNPADNAMIDSVIGCFQGNDVPGKIQHGSAWWFSDTKAGMTSQIKSLAELSILSNFIGMLTDSRSFLSYTRHEYFRRIFCDILGGWVEDGEYPADMPTLKALVRGVCFENAERYFNI
ncbi:MAG: glucuronate isomerase [Clostridia bacterium]|nr:glucuronate isomerase [Clostridia bacterium]